MKPALNWSAVSSLLDVTVPDHGVTPPRSTPFVGGWLAARSSADFCCLKGRELWPRKGTKKHEEL